MQKWTLPLLLIIRLLLRSRERNRRTLMVHGFMTQWAMNMKEIKLREYCRRR